MASQDGCSRLLQRVTRDLQAPMALLVADHPTRRVMGHRGIEDHRPLRELLALDLTKADRSIRSDPADVARSWASAPVYLDGIEVGTLFVADRRRRWFDDEEVRHLGLMTFVAATLIAERTALDLDAVDVRDERAPLTTLV